ncbi:MAG: cytochrome b/b6 domain-containing protein [Roseibium aggregatum]|jgi:cytochrome b561|uniref:cytochrome b n=1 Tax=uncultured Roseibium sp. TaxID=1936171 RepID=UPI00261997B9|nr:cytochrome b/b6 domain-containing protein [uncultured Roseibium sp.]
MPEIEKTTQAAHSYTRLQIVLHWLVVILIAGQWYTSSAIPRTHDPFLAPSRTDLLLHMVHNYSGMLIGGLMVIRLGLWLLNPPRRETGLRSWQTSAASTVHWALYLSVLGQASTGFVSSYLWQGAVPFHKMFWNLTMALVGLHVAAAIYHLARGDEVVVKMRLWRPGR